MRRASNLILAVFLTSAVAGWSEACKVWPEHTPTDAELVFQKGDHNKAAAMLRDDLAKSPNDPDKAALLIRALLWPRKTDEAVAVLNKALAAHPNSASLLTEKAEVLFRQGRPWEVGSAIGAALKVDPCFPRAFIIYDWLMHSESKPATAIKAIQTAHQLDPHDAEIRDYWWNTLPLPQRIASMQQLVDSGSLKDQELVTQMRKRLDALKERASEPPQPCTLISAAKSAEVPLQEFIAERHGDLAAAGRALSVDINGHRGLLALDTGASGVWVTKTMAEHAGLKPLGTNPDLQHDYRAHADHIQVGDLDFKDCMVQVVNSVGRDRDGMIGADVFSQFLVTLDFPMHKIKLDPLPSVPQPGANSAPALSTRGEDQANPQTANNGGVPPEDSEGEPATDRYIGAEMKDWLPVYRVSQRLIVPVSLHPPDLKVFLVNTGLWTTLVAPEAAREVTKVDVNGNLRAFDSKGNSSNTYVAEALDFKFGGISKHEMGVPAVDLDSQSMWSAMHISGILGSDILEELTIRIDYRDGVMKFEYDPKRGYHPLNR